VNTRLRLFAALVSIAIAVACVLEGARDESHSKRTMRVVEQPY
jgi:hypothetical protein